MTFCHTHRSVPRLPFIRESSYCTENHSTQSQMIIFIPPPTHQQHHPRPRILCRKGGRNVIKDRRLKMMEPESSRHNSNDTHMNSQTVASPTRPVQIQTNQGPNTKKVKWTQCASHNLGLFAIDTSRERENQLFSTGVSLGTPTTLRGRPRVQK